MDQRPAILALHGAGTNSEIFSLQAQSIVKQLQDHFRFVFINAPFESRPGPGVAPTYLGMGPYFWWHCDESAATQFDITIKEVRRRRELVRELFRSTIETEKVTGLMAFSQGARVATGLCLDPDLGRNIRLVITISATFPALGIHEDVASLLPQVLRMPSVHVQGTSDPWVSEGKRLRMQYFDCDQASVVHFEGGHTVPSGKKDVERVVRAILKAWSGISDSLSTSMEEKRDTPCPPVQAL